MSAEHRDRRGSIWRRWDPHVHLPGTVLSDQYGSTTVAEALDALASRSPAIEAVGITDYACTKSYREALQAWEGGAGAGIRLLFPNVELRLNVPTAKGPGVNLHLLCAPSDVDELDGFLAELEFEYGGATYRASSQSLARLGRAFRGEPALDEHAALREGTNQFKVDFNQLRSCLRRSGWAMEHCLIGVAGGEGDGTSGIRDEEGAFAALREEIESAAHIIFSGNPKQREYWLGHGVQPRAEIEARYGGRKLCLHGSDAHRPEQLGAPDKDRFMWLKGNASFDGLRQACIEPELRAWVGKEPPDITQREGRIELATVASNGWFPEEPVPLNTGLIAIIGPRGSGKTALADVIAAGAHSPEPFRNENSFLSRAHDLVNDSQVGLTWTDGEITSIGLSGAGLDADHDLFSAARYLSQQFVESLCAADGLSDELIAEMERVVFDSWPVADRLGATSFSELRDLRLQAARARQSAHLEAIGYNTDRIADERAKKDAAEIKAKQLEAVAKKVADLASEVDKLTKEGDKVSVTRLKEVTEVLQHRENELQVISRRINALEVIQQRVQTSRDHRFPAFTDELRAAGRDAGLSDSDWAAFDIQFVGAVDTILAGHLTSVRQQYSTIEGTPPLDGSSLPVLDGLSKDMLTQQAVAVLRLELVRLRTLAGVDERRAKRLAAIASNQGLLRAETQSLTADIEEASKADDRIEAFMEQRIKEYRAYFDALLEEEAELENLYAPLTSVFADAGTAVGKLQLVVKRIVDLPKWSEAGESLLDLRTEGRFRGRGSLQGAAQPALLEAWTHGDGSAAAEAISEFLKEYGGDFHAQRKPEGTREGQREWLRKMARWLYGTEHIRLVYSLEYDGVDIQRLSPGTRGIVLLLLYLAVDRHESTPLIIDQPEENLDPQSVYTELVSLFRRASERRQVIMVTHNANLVVNTDVDQVIVASCGPLERGRLPAFTYLSGGLEDASIREAVCQVLEGGEEAFKDRARRLRVRI